MNTMTHWGWSGGFWPLIPLFWGLFWVAVVAFAARAWRRGQWGPRRAEVRATASAEQILAERYARGEMSHDEYFERMSVLRGG
ncbi:hypothetical protein ABT294_41345 [Nonomuraea sp. NPDC000554]|uniref:hypothetical protein n=1 Tax=Nonomuraea sp. NPDC000554 TaxID=3154259 RepID=UPI0033240E9C